VSIARAWQRETHARLEHLESELAELRARAERERLRPPSPVIAIAPESSPTDPGAPAAVARTSREVIEAPAVGRPQLSPIAQVYEPPAAQPVAPATPFVRDAEGDQLARLARESVGPMSFDAGALSGARRARTVKVVMTIVILVLVGGLVALAIASQSGVKV